MGINSNNTTTENDRAESVLTDETTGRRANIIQRSDGNNALATDATVTVEQLFGRDPIPDTFFGILTAGAIGDTVRVQVAGTANDSTTPDRDLLAVDLTYTLIAEDVGDEVLLADNIVTYLNAQAAFGNAYLKADRVGGDLRAIIHVTSTEFSMSGEFAERPNAGDFSVTPSGATTVSVGFDNVIARGKATSLARDPDNPHRLGVLGISGSVVTTPGAIGDIFFEHATNGGNRSLLVDGDPTSVTFTIPADPDKDIFVENLRFHGVASSIKFGQFLSISTLPNGLVVEIKSDDQTIVLTKPTINNTEDFFAEWATALKSNELYSQPSSHMFISDFLRDNPFPIRKQGAYATDDYIKVIVNDDLTSASLDQLELQAFGFKKEA